MQCRALFLGMFAVARQDLFAVGSLEQGDELRFRVGGFGVELNLFERFFERCGIFG